MHGELYVLLQSLLVSALCVHFLTFFSWARVWTHMLRDLDTSNVHLLIIMLIIIEFCYNYCNYVVCIAITILSLCQIAVEDKCYKEIEDIQPIMW